MNGARGNRRGRFCGSVPERPLSSVGVGFFFAALFFGFAGGFVCGYIVGVGRASSPTAEDDSPATDRQRAYLDSLIRQHEPPGIPADAADDPELTIHAASLLIDRIKSEAE